MARFAPLARNDAGTDFPVRIVLAYIAAATVAATLVVHGTQSGRPSLLALGGLVWLLAGLALVAAIGIWRDDDLLAAGVVVALTGVLGGGIGTALSQVILHRSIGAALLLFMTNLLPFALILVLAIPVSVLAVWLARLLGDGLGLGPRAKRHHQPR